MSDLPRRNTDPMSRRSLLKKLGVGTAIVWGAPLLSTMEAQAGHTSLPGQGAACRFLAEFGNNHAACCEPLFNSRACSICDPPECRVNDQCGRPCLCVPRVSNSCCFCANFSGSNFDPCAGVGCNVNGDCPGGQGFVCVRTCCFGTGFKGKCRQPCRVDP